MAKPVRRTQPRIDATVAGTLSTSFVTLKFANQYHGDLLSGKAWEAHEISDRERALNSATADIDNTFRSAGAWWDKHDLVDPEQALVFPRTGDRTNAGVLEILDDVEDATCILALHKLEEAEGGDPISLTAMQNDGARMVNAGGMTVISKGRRWSSFPKEVEQLLAPYIHRGGRVTSGRSYRKRRWHEGQIAE